MSQIVQSSFFLFVTGTKGSQKQDKCLFRILRLQSALGRGKILRKFSLNLQMEQMTTTNVSGGSGFNTLLCFYELEMTIICQKRIWRELTQADIHILPSVSLKADIGCTSVTQRHLEKYRSSLGRAGQEGSEKRVHQTSLPPRPVIQKEGFFATVCPAFPVTGSLPTLCSYLSSSF